jgi:lipoprotein NlpD
VAGSAASAAGAAASASSADAGPRPYTEPGGQPGYYTVRAGDTLLRIGLETGQNWRDIARWNNIENPSALEVGSQLRVTPPAGETVATTRPVAPAPRIESRPLDTRAPAAASTPAPAASPAAATASPPPPPAPVPVAPSPPAAPRDGEGDIVWSWPASGPVTTPFDDVRSKGLAIAGKAGDPVLAAADGRVVYAGSGLRGYGNLVIVKHNATYLTAYAHNQSLLVKEDQVVRRGQKIAEMGSSDTDRVQLHFEVRRLGKPVDPARVLPAR